MYKNSFEVFLGTYNAAPWIQDVILSLEEQDCEPFTVKIIDNDSNDATLKIIENLFESFSFKNSYELIKNSQNIGAISSFLDRLDLFEAEWIFMIHQDDVYHENHVSTLKKAIDQSSDSTGIVFTGMKRINEDNEVAATPPTLSSKLSSLDRLSNFMIGLQISPINFPATALKKSFLQKIDTSRHTTAFNDMELLLRMMCISDVNYEPNETMHYRTFSGNASRITSSYSNDRAVFIGMNEILHSPEFLELSQNLKNEDEISQLVNSIKQAIEIRLSSPDMKRIARNTLAESLVRIFGYSNNALNTFLQDSLINLDCRKEAKTVENLRSLDKFDSKHLEGLGRDRLSSNSSISVIKSKNIFINLFDSIPLASRERFFNYFFNIFLFRFVKRPFIRVWRLTKNGRR